MTPIKPEPKDGVVVDSSIRCRLSFDVRPDPHHPRTSAANFQHFDPWLTTT
jgi:hypothetical protein